MKIKYIALSILIGISANVGAQEKSGREKRADKQVFTFNYSKAIEKYKRTKNLTIEGQRNLAISYHKVGRDIESEAVYEKNVVMALEAIPEDFYNYSMVLKINGKFVESAVWMDTFLLEKPNDLRSKSYKYAHLNLDSLQLDDSKFKILSMDINSDCDDFGTCYFKDKIVFSSTRATPSALNRKYNWNYQPFLNLYVADLNGKQLNNPEVLDKKFHSKFHDGPATFNEDGTFIAFSRNNLEEKNKDKVVDLQICFSYFIEGVWTKPEPFIFNNTEYSVGQPHLSKDAKTLFFTSDMPGGFGGTDLYKTIRDESGIWQKPVNLGNKINTEGDEMFPFLEEKNSVLFFSSNGHFGFGGLDNFMSVTDGEKFGAAINCGFPLNTQHDDYALIVNDSLTNGYFSSDRSVKGFNHIYSVDIVKGFDLGMKIQGIAKDKNGAGLFETLVLLTNDKTNQVDSLTTSTIGAYSFIVPSNQKYHLVGIKKGFHNGENTASTFGKDPVVIADLLLMEKYKIDSTKLIVGTDIGKIIKDDKNIFQGNLKMEIAYFDLNKYNIRPDAAEELNKIVSIMNEFKTIVIQLGSFTDCSASNEYNQILSDKRAKSSVDYIKSRISNPERISGKGYGESKLVNGCNCEGTIISTCPDDENQLNRRTEFIIIKN